MTPRDATLTRAARRRGEGFHFSYFGGSGWLVGLMCALVLVALATWWQVAKRRGRSEIEE